MTRRTVIGALLCAATLLFAMPAHAYEPETGKVRFVNEAHSAYDQFTYDPSPALAAWMRDKFYRQKAYYPYFDSRTSWYPNAWAYKDAYAIYQDDAALQNAHPEWILKDSASRRMYIPWGCSNGTCPQYAADIGNPAFRAHWIEEARATLSHGYRGVFIDDVNMEFRVGNGDGVEVAPMNPRTGRQMTLAEWRRYMADFMEEIRAAFPEKEIAHNPIWFSGHDDPDVARALLAADYIDLERGVNDSGITAGGGRYGYETLLGHVEWLHQRGKAVVWDSYTNSEAGTEYLLASYFLVNGERDGLRSDYRNAPTDWWSGYEVDLGAARGARYTQNGLERRDFERGYVLVNQPYRAPVTVSTPGATGPDGRARSSVTLAGGQGAVVMTAAASSPPPAPEPQPDPEPDPDPAPDPDPTPDPDPDPIPEPAPEPDPDPESEPGPVRSPNPPNGPSTPPAGSSGFAASGGSGAPVRRKRTRTTIVARVMLRQRRAVMIRGRVRGHSGGRAKVRLFRRAGSRWKRVATIRIRLRADGSFKKRLSGFPPGSYRVKAAYAGSPRSAASAAASRFRLR